MMHVHHKWLGMADAFDALAAAGARLRVHAQAALARLSLGEAPVGFVAGPATPHELVDDGPLARLLHYRARGAARPTPIVIVASLINRYYVLDLLPELSVIDQLCRHGFDVFVLDWKAPGEDGPERGFDDYVDGAIGAAVRRAGNEVGLLGYCMGGTLAVMYAARHSQTLRWLTLLGTPIDFHQSGRLAEWTRPERFDADLMMDVFGNMPPWLMQSGFKLLNPADALAKLVRLHQNAGDEQAIRQYVALESWLDDNVAFPGGVYREYIKALYQDNALCAGSFRIGGEIVDLAKLTAPLLDVIALRDHICSPPSSRALLPLVGSADKQLLEFDTGHIGLTTSRRSHRELWPRIISWMEERSRVSGA
jgi:poly[(R)-3-hydroxyalkanoate] polymerase subunit PhaC